MQILDNINALWGDDLKATIKSGAKLKIAASCFSIYAYEALKREFEIKKKNKLPQRSIAKECAEWN